MLFRSLVSTKASNIISNSDLPVEQKPRAGNLRRISAPQSPSNRVLIPKGQRNAELALFFTTGTSSDSDSHDQDLVLTLSNRNNNNVFVQDAVIQITFRSGSGSIKTDPTASVETVHYLDDANPHGKHAMRWKVGATSPGTTRTLNLRVKTHGGVVMARIIDATVCDQNYLNCAYNLDPSGSIVTALAHL